MEWQNKENVLWNLKLLRLKFPKMFLILDKATWNKNKIVMGWMEREKIPYMFFPTGASDLNPVEFCWKKTRDEVTANESHNSKKELYDHLESFWRKHVFEHNVFNYLSP